MADTVTQHNIAALLTLRAAAALASFVAGSANDNAQIVGVALDRVALKLPRNVEFSIAFTATLAANATLTLKGVKIQDSADGVTWADFSTFADPGVVATGPAGGGAVTGQVNVATGINGSRQYVRFVFTPDLSAANTDTAIVAALAILAGFDRLPAAA